MHIERECSTCTRWIGGENGCMYRVHGITVHVISITVGLPVYYSQHCPCHCHQRWSSFNFYLSFCNFLLLIIVILIIIIITTTTTITIARTRNNTSTTIHITTFEFAFCIDDIACKITFIFKEHIIN